MCGIAGWAGSGEPEVLHQMVKTLEHRGPDEIGLWVNPAAALGISRLSIIDVAKGHQPVFSQDRSVVAVMNGEIYNYRDLARAVCSRGLSLASGSDAEVIPHLYEQHGIHFLDHLRGMFAIALWDANVGRLILARDRVGEKPLVFHRQSSKLIFASEARALLATGWKPDADLSSLDHVLAFGYLPSAAGAFEGLESVPPGHVAIWEQGQLRLQRYWSWDRGVQLRSCDALPVLKETLEDAVKVRMISDRPVGAFLSGGVDSSIVTALMVRNSSERVKTFSIGFEDREFDEAPYAAEVSRFLNTDHTTLQVSPNPEAMLNRLVSAYDQPLADSSAIPTMLLSELARQEVVVALSGDGGDEAFGGYERYVAAPRLQQLNPLLHALEPLARLAASKTQRRQSPRLARILTEVRGRPSLEDRYRSIMTLVPSRDRHKIWTTAAAQEIDLSVPELSFQRLWEMSRGLPALERMRYQDLHSYLPGDLLVKVDIASMSTSLEVRSPLLDQEVLKVALSLPPASLIHKNKTKWILRQLAGDLLPPALMQRRKHGFGVPLAKWLRGPLREVVSDTLLGPTVRERGWFRTEEVNSILNRHMAGEDEHKQIWPLLIIELWATHWLR